MKTFLFLFISSFFLTINSLQGQIVEIRQKNIDKKYKFKAIVKLLNGDKYSGKFSGYTDSTVTLSIYRRYEGGHFYNDEEFQYDLIDYIKLKRKLKGYGPIIGFASGAFVGYIAAELKGESGTINAGLIQFPYHRHPTTGQYIAGVLSGGIIGGAAGLAIGSATSRKYTFNINGDYNSFQYHLRSFKFMVLDPSEFMDTE